MAVGLIKYGTEVVESVSKSGVVTMQGTTVRGLTHVQGTLSVSDAMLHSLKMQGTINSNNTQFSHSVHVQGMMHATNSIFKGVLTISTKELHLNNCTTKDIKILRNSYNPGPQKVILDNRSIVDGNIYFQAPEGEVQMKEGSRVTGSVFKGSHTDEL